MAIRGAHPDLLPFEPSPTHPFSRVCSAHLLNRAAFGGTPEDIDEVLLLGPERAVDRLLSFPDSPASEQDKTNLPDLSGLSEFPSDFDHLSQMFAGMGERDSRILRGRMIDAHRVALLNVLGWWMKRMAYGKYPLQEKLAFFWHGHFTTSSYDVWSTRMLWEQNELLRRHAAGDFSSLLSAICHDPAMLQYLDNATSHRDAPNENFARELLELFTLGIDHYSEDDIRAIARAFTGWSHDGEHFVFRSGDHDFGEKKIFNQSGTFDGGDVIQLILRQRACAEFIATRLYCFFVRQPVDAELAASLGETFTQTNLNVRLLLRTILCSRAFYDPAAMGTQIKSPVQLMAGTIRQLDLPMPDAKALREHLSAMGQVPYLPPDVKGWPGGRAWINTSTLFSRQNALLWLAEMLPSAPATEMPWDAKVDQWLGRLIPQSIAAEKRGVLLNLPVRDADASRQLVQLILALPEYEMG